MNRDNTIPTKQAEWIGDAALSFLIKLVLSERYPEDGVDVLRVRHQCYITNQFLTDFCESKGYTRIGCDGKERGYGGDEFEIMLCDLILKDFVAAKALVGELLNFGIRDETERKVLEETYKNVRHKLSQLGLSFISPCVCGSFALSITKKQVRCLVCNHALEITASKKEKTRFAIDTWNRHVKNVNTAKLQNTISFDI